MFNTRYVPLRAGALCACLLLPALLTGCGGGSSTPSVLIPANTGPVTSTPRTANGLQYTLSSDKSVYKAGEAVKLTYTFANVSSQNVADVIGLLNVIVTVTQGSQQIYLTPQPQISGGAAFGPSFGLPPSSSQTYIAFWPQTATSSRKQVATGQYTITATLNDVTSDHQPTNAIQITIVP